MSKPPKNGSRSKKTATKATFGKDQPEHYCGKPGRSGPPKGNRNAMRHGLKAGQLPKDAKYIEVRLNIFRRQLEDTVLAIKGEVSLEDAAYIQTALRWERHAALAQRWLNKEGENMKPADKLNFSREIAKASAERDKAIGMLGLEQDVVQDAWAVLDATPNLTHDDSDGDDDAE